MKKPFAIPVIAMVLCAVVFGVHIAFLDGVDGILCTVLLGPDEDTVYAGGYNISSFRKIRNGIPQAEVLAILGEPIDRFGMKEDSSADDGWWYRRADSDAEGWSYSKSANSSHYRKRIVVFRDSRVVDKIAKFYVD